MEAIKNAFEFGLGNHRGKRYAPRYFAVSSWGAWEIVPAPPRVRSISAAFFSQSSTT